MEDKTCQILGPNGRGLLWFLLLPLLLLLLLMLLLLLFCFSTQDRAFAASQVARRGC